MPDGLQPFLFAYVTAIRPFLFLATARIRAVLRAVLRILGGKRIRRSRRNHLSFRALRLGSIYPQDVGTDREFRVSVGDEETLLECRVSGVPPHFVPARLFARGDSLVWCVGFSSGLLRNVNVCEESRLAALPAAAACRAA